MASSYFLFTGQQLKNIYLFAHSPIAQAYKSAGISVNGGNVLVGVREDGTTASGNIIGDLSPTAVGTNNATAGIHPVAENGYELVFGRQNRLFNGGEKVLTHEQTKAFLQKQQNNEPFQVRQGQFQLAKPQQVQVAVVGGNNVKVDVQVNGGSSDVEVLIQQVTQEVGRKLKEAFTNIE